jgi:hypothetical protein
MEYTEAFIPVARNMEQMGQQMSLKFNGQNVAVSAMGQNMQLTMNGAYISDGPGMDQLLAGLPLANNYELVFDMPNLTTMKTKQAVLKVMGKESLNGSNCWKVVVAATENENDKTTFWINETTKVADKIEAVLPAMGNAKMTYTRK